MLESDTSFKALVLSVDELELELEHGGVELDEQELDELDEQDELDEEEEEEEEDEEEDEELQA